MWPCCGALPLISCMRRFCRHTTNSVSLASFVLLVLVLGLLAMSYSFAHSIAHLRRPGGRNVVIGLLSFRGEIVWQSMDLPSYQPMLVTDGWNFRQFPIEDTTAWNFSKGRRVLGVRSYHLFQGETARSHQSISEVGIPHWMIAAVCAIAPFTRFIGHRWWRRRRAIAGLCLTCGYDLRATPERCPECGFVAARSEAI
jgi:hypothetical protein